MIPTPEFTPAETTELPGPDLFMTVLKVADWDGAVAWYVETLGLLKVLVDPARRFALLAAGNGRLALQGDPAAGEAARRGVRLVFQVPDVDRERCRLEGRGVRVAGPIEDEREGFREIRLEDPEGTPLTLFSWTAEARRRRFASPPEE